MRLIFLAAVFGYIATLKLLDNRGINATGGYLKSPDFSSEEVIIGLFVVCIILLLEGLVRLADDRTRKMVGSLAKTQALSESQDEINELVASSRSYAEEVNKLEAELKEVKSSLEKAEKEIEESIPSDDEDDIKLKGQLEFLRMLQEKGKLVDFMMRDITEFEDSKVGSVARFVHNGCSSAIKQSLKLSPFHEKNEGETVTFDKPYDAKEFHITGSVPDELPFSGKLTHRGWVAKSVENDDLNNVVYPIQVEVV